ncbi:MAG TPA: hypothetical protein VFA43_22890 [Gemmatimonadaceae bacterium]|nr:hypothetical protein [Gemmatimonadaceae bacterium]
MRRPFATVAVLGTATAVFSLVGCGGSTSPSQTNFKSLNAGQQAEFENEAVVEVESNISSFVNFDPYGGFGFARVAPRRGGALAQILAAKAAKRPRFQSSGSCDPTVSGTTTDEDSDNIPDNATATFNCNSSQSGTTVTESGTLSFTDPTPAVSDLEFNSTVNLSIGETGSTDGDLSLSLAGQSALTQSTGLLSDAGNATLNLALTNAPSNGNGTLKLQTQSSATYAFTGAQPVSFGSLPDGTFNLTGNWAYDIKSSTLTANLSFAISTPGGLVITSSCTSNGGNIESGEIDIKFGDGTLVKAVYSGCPVQPTYTIS